MHSPPVSKEALNQNRDEMARCLVPSSLVEKADQPLRPDYLALLGRERLQEPVFLPHDGVRTRPSGSGEQSEINLATRDVFLACEPVATTRSRNSPIRHRLECGLNAIHQARLRHGCAKVDGYATVAYST